MCAMTNLHGRKSRRNICTSSCSHWREWHLSPSHWWVLIGSKQPDRESHRTLEPRSAQPAQWKKQRVFAVASAVIADAFGGLFAGAGRKMPRSAHAKLRVALALLLFSGTPAWACGWWDCRDGYGSRKQVRVYGYNSPGPRSGASGRITTRTGVWGAPPNINANSGLQGPGYLSNAGIMNSPMIAPGPSLFGPTSGAYTYTSVPQGSRQYRRSGLRSR